MVWSFGANAEVIYSLVLRGDWLAGHLVLPSFAPLFNNRYGPTRSYNSPPKWNPLTVPVYRPAAFLLNSKRTLRSSSPSLKYGFASSVRKVSLVPSPEIFQLTSALLRQAKTGAWPGCDERQRSLVIVILDRFPLDNGQRWLGSAAWAALAEQPERLSVAASWFSSWSSVWTTSRPCSPLTHAMRWDRGNQKAHGTALDASVGMETASLGRDRQRPS
jgi:hypothetical protein